MTDITKDKETGETGLEIAVIGMAGRFPGARNISEFWNNLKNGVETITFFSTAELEEAGCDPGLLKNPKYVKAMGYLQDIEYFDGSFFGYTPMESEVTDPQMRIFHECAWEALEDAGYDPGSYSGRIGFYSGGESSSFWETLTTFSPLAQYMDPLILGNLNNKDYLSTRIAYKFNLKGPTFTIHTACSTSLVAIHLAVQGLLNGETEIALAGGVRVSLPGKSGYLYQEGMINSPDGHCRAFDAKAKGTVAGDGAGLVVLKSFEEAIADGDHIYAVIKGSAINNDGIRKVGFHAPSINGQSEVISAALYLAEAEPESIGYIETHGTGTELGDTVELEALKLAFNLNQVNSCAIGSVKTNVGHLGCAAGVTGFIKTVLILKHRLIPPSLHFEKPNPKIDFKNSPFYVNTHLKAWQAKGFPLRAGVSSFGIGGANAHVILEAVGTKYRLPGEAPDRPYQLLLLSARTASALEKMRQNLAGYLEENTAISLADAAYTLQVGRKRFALRQKLVCTGTADAIKLLCENSSTYTAQAVDENRDVIFMFPGLGPQYVNM
ncbi:MAG TPA: type I polyketide synthase, partial [Candidatus Deferrimicrobium sp.]|nr:type I polyketide synthase [Candidatus Deferrimicrobium sp.]